MTPAPIVVGVDGSPPSRAALRWAAEEAALRGAVLHVVHVSHYPVGFGPTFYPVVEPAEMVEQAEHLAREEVDGTLGSRPPAGLVVRGVLGMPGETLVHAADGAAMLVVGSRGHGGLGGLLLGSVSQHCVHHAGCPVVVVPGEDRGR